MKDQDNKLRGVFAGLSNAFFIGKYLNSAAFDVGAYMFKVSPVWMC